MSFILSYLLLILVSQAQVTSEESAPQPAFSTAGLGEAVLCPDAHPGTNDNHLKALSDSARDRVERRKNNEAVQ